MTFSEKTAAAVLSLLITLFTFITVISLLFGNTFSDPDFMIGVLEKHDYYDHIFDEYSEALEDLAVPSGVPAGRFTAVVTKAELSAAVNATVRSAYSVDVSYAGEAVNSETVYYRFYDCHCEVAIESGYKINDDLIPALQNVAELCTETYKTYATLPFIDTIGSYAVEFDRIFKIAEISCTAFLVFFLFLLFVRKALRKNAAAVFALSFNTVGFMLSIAPIAVLASGKIKYLNISIRSLYNFAVGYSSSVLYLILNCGITFLLVGCGFVALHFFLTKKKTSAEHFERIQK